MRRASHISLRRRRPFKLPCAA